MNGAIIHLIAFFVELGRKLLFKASDKLSERDDGIGRAAEVVRDITEDKGANETVEDLQTQVLNQDYYRSMRTDFPDRNEEIEGIIKEKDPGFSAEVLCAFAKEVFDKFELALGRNDIAIVGDCITDELRDVTAKKMRNDYISGKHHLRMVEADKAHLTSYENAGGIERLAVYITVRRIPWQNLDRQDKVISEGIISGPASKPKEKIAPNVDARYRLRFERTANGEWKLYNHEQIRYNSVDEGIKIT